MKPKKLKEFVTVDKIQTCQSCGKEQSKLNFVKITFWYTDRVYIGSGMPIRTNYRVNLCKKCFPEIEKKIKNIII